MARTGYTGEDGFEVFLPVEGNLEAVKGFWNVVLSAGEEFGIQPVGLGARDTLRLEARMNLYGNEMNDSTPHKLESLGLSPRVKKDLLDVTRSWHTKEKSGSIVWSDSKWTSVLPDLTQQ